MTQSDTTCNEVFRYGRNAFKVRVAASGYPVVLMRRLSNQPGKSTEITWVMTRRERRTDALSPLN